MKCLSVFTTNDVTEWLILDYSHLFSRTYEGRSERTKNASRYYDTLTKLTSAFRPKRSGLLSREVLFLDDDAIAGHRFLPVWFLETDFTVR
ncbi:hypothetical protein AVEN_13820-1 [Araneus ventricosus]|uniref:Uncharacterized protein n=1 Tax=Araneus ventricosus TaxID=182803 RepID=A0A4Y2UCA4_ARAVE|nr:hypothetical protein AVEN_13820-1 [Araneus ventricosus]